MSTYVDSGEAADRLEELVEAALRGDSIVITVDGEPQVRLVPVEAAKPK